MPTKKKSELYPEEQARLKAKVIEMVGFDEQMSFTLLEIDENKTKQDEFMAILPELKKYFTLSKITNIHNPQVAVRPWLSIIKHVLKEDYEIFNKHVVVDGKHTSRYILRKKTT